MHGQERLDHGVRRAAPAVDLQQRDQSGAHFVPTASGSSTYFIQPMTPDYCTDVNADSSASGAAIIQYPCNYASNEEFTLTSVGTNEYHVIAANSGLCWRRRAARPPSGPPSSRSPAAAPTPPGRSPNDPRNPEVKILFHPERSRGSRPPPIAPLP